MAMIRPETEMKDSGIDWLGTMPIGWKIKPLYACLDEINQKNDPVVTTNILSLTNTEGVIPYSERGNQGNKSKENFEEYKVVYPDTIVANSMNILIGSVGLSKYEGCVSPVYYVYSAKPSADIRYMNYLFQMEQFQKRLRQFANGILEIRLRVSSHDILHQKVALPDYAEQQAIADYLDETCSKIDAIIAEAKASIEKYKELKQAVIFEAVTKGLDKNVEMKDSGVEWIGEIPINWQSKKLKYACSVRNENYTDDKGVLDYFALENIVSWESRYISTENEYDISGSKLCYAGDIVFGKLRPYLAKTYLVTYDRCCSSEFAIFYGFEGLTKYFLYLFTSYGFVNVVNDSTNGTKMPRANIEFIKNVIIPVPDEETQKCISAYLDDIVPKYDSLITEKQSLIEDLEAYKKSLIYEVVTGKRRVV